MLGFMELAVSMYRTVSFDPKGWLMNMIILGPAAVAHDVNKESDSFRKQILQVHLI